MPESTVGDMRMSLDFLLNGPTLSLVFKTPWTCITTALLYWVAAGCLRQYACLSPWTQSPSLKPLQSALNTLVGIASTQRSIVTISVDETMPRLLLYTLTPLDLLCVFLVLATPLILWVDWLCVAQSTSFGPGYSLHISVDQAPSYYRMPEVPLAVSILLFALAVTAAVLLLLCRKSLVDANLSRELRQIQIQNHQILEELREVEPEEQALTVDRYSKGPSFLS